MSIERFGDVQNVTVPDKSALSEVIYSGAPFASQTVRLEINDNGTLKSVGLDSGSSPPPGIGVLNSLNSVAGTARDFGKTVQQAKLDEVQRRVNLIKAKNDLDALLK